MKLIDFLDRGALLYPDRVCLQHDDGTHAYSYADTSMLSHRIGSGLLAAGLDKGSTFAVYSPNHALAFIAVLGGVRIGARWVNLNARSALEETIGILNDNQCAFLFYHSCLGANVAVIREQVPHLKGLLCIDNHDADNSRDEPLLRWSEDFSPETPDLDMGEEEIGAHFNTGGTTGTPKAALLSNRSMSTMSAAFLSYMHFDRPPVHLVVAPMTHAAGALMFPLISLGATNVVVTDPQPGQILRDIERYGVNVLFLPPTLIYMLLAQPDVDEHDYGSLRYFIYAAAPMAPGKLQQALEVFGPVMMQTFGQVEAPMMLTCMTPAEHVDAVQDPAKRHRLMSCGRPTMYALVEIMDDDGHLLPHGERGEIVCRGPLVMSGYHNNPAETAVAGEFGWHHTGDIGYRDQDGYFYIVDRKKDVIISGGFNVYPSEIEACILDHPAIQECAVVGVPDDKWGEAVTAVIELKPEATVDRDALIAECKRQLGGVKAPKRIEVWDRLPRSPVGKVLRKAVRETFWEGRERRV